MANEQRKKLPLVYSCSGCSSAAQMANYIAVRLDRTQQAEMSCIAGVGGDVPSLVRVAKSGREMVVLDGCPLQCAKNSLKRHGVTPDMHYTLSDFDVKKRIHEDYDKDDADRILALVGKEIAEKLVLVKK